jgi:hypothetical protein
MQDKFATEACYRADTCNALDIIWLKKQSFGSLFLQGSYFYMMTKAEPGSDNIVQYTMRLSDEICVLI